MVIITTNIKSIIGRVIILLCLFTGLYFINFGIHQKIDAVPVLYMLGVILCFFIINILMSLLGIIKVSINTSARQITFIRLFSKQTISDKEIVGFYSSYYNTKHGTSYGRIIKLNGDKVKELNPGI